MMTSSECARWLREHDNYLILTHHRPDGDTLGSAAFLCRTLRSLGKTAHILRNPEITPKYEPLHQGLTVDAAQEGHTIVCVDTASPSMVPRTFAHLLDKIQLRIDHHSTATSFTPYELVEPEAGACGEILWDLSVLLEVKLDKPMADALYTALSTDTGCFRYANTTAHSFLTAAACAQAGADLPGINQVMFDTNSLAKLRIQSWMIGNARFLGDGRAVVCAIPLAIEQEIGVTEDDMDNISGYPRSIEGVKVAATLREIGGGRVKLSVRALPGYDASAICAQFGGGGHKGAAGANLSLPLAEAADVVAAALEGTM